MDFTLFTMLIIVASFLLWKIKYKDHKHCSTVSFFIMCLFFILYVSTVFEPIITEQRAFIQYVSLSYIALFVSIFVHVNLEERSK